MLKVKTLLVTVFALLAIVGSTSTPAAAQTLRTSHVPTAHVARPSVDVDCYTSPSASTCNGQDPGLSSCDWDATTVASRSLIANNQQYGLLELRWSNHCQTNWARVTSYIGNREYRSYVALIRYDGGSGNWNYPSYPYSTPETAGIYYGEVGTIYTPMYYAPNGIGYCMSGFGFVNDNSGYNTTTYTPYNSFTYCS